MNSSDHTLDALTLIINGDRDLGLSPYRSGPQLIEFFRKFGEDDTYGQSFGSRYNYTNDKLTKFNRTKQLDDIVCTALNFWNTEGFDPRIAVEHLNKYLVRDGYLLEIPNKYRWMDGDTLVQGAPYVYVRELMENSVQIGSIAKMRENAVTEQIRKASLRIETGDFAGAIASAYTLVEQILKFLLKETRTDFKENEGDIRSLYKQLRTPLNLDPGAETIEVPLKPILNGFHKLVEGLYDVSNKASDRHVRKYDPAKHHAKLAVNSALTLCEFLLESYKYQLDQNSNTIDSHS